jgi:hypothetical protein
MRRIAVTAVTVAAIAALAVPADAAQKKPVQVRPVQLVQRTPTGTVIQPTTTIIPHADGSRTVIVIPRRRSYLDTGTEVSVGDRSFMDYMLPPGGDPGRVNWNGGPDYQGGGTLPIGPFYVPGLNPDTPF